MMIGTVIPHKIKVKHRKSTPNFGRSLDKGTKLVSITKNITSVNRIVERKGILSPPPFGRNRYSNAINAIARPGAIIVTVTVAPVLLIMILNVTSE